MDDMTPRRWRRTAEYGREVFGREDEHLAGLMTEAVAAGLPDIAVDGHIGRLLMILTSMTRGRLAVEVGTLAGYSAIWIARGLAADGRLITIEQDSRHADFAEQQLQRAGVSDRVEVRRGGALEILPQLARELGDRSVDVVFIDAEKTEYPEYWAAVEPMIAVGGVVLADNVYGTDRFWIDDGDVAIDDGDVASRRATDAFNRSVAGHPDFEAVAVPLRQGILMGRRMGRRFDGS